MNLTNEQLVNLLKEAITPKERVVDSIAVNEYVVIIKSGNEVFLMPYALESGTKDTAKYKFGTWQKLPELPKLDKENLENVVKQIIESK